jgi:hypothetical protein
MPLLGPDRTKKMGEKRLTLKILFVGKNSGQNPNFENNYADSLTTPVTSTVF